MTWLATPPDAPFECSICARDSSAGPFWIGPRVQTGNAGFAGPAEGHVKVCKNCFYVAAEGPDSPFHGLIPAGRTAKERIAELEELNAGMRSRLHELQANSGQPAGLARLVREAIRDALAERGLPSAPKEKT